MVSDVIGLRFRANVINDPAYSARQENTRQRTAAINSNIGHQPGPPRNKELNRLIDRGHHNEKDRKVEQVNPPRDPRHAKRARSENPQHKVFGEMRCLAHKEVRYPCGRRANRVEDRTNRIDHKQAEGTAPLPGDQRVTPDKEREDECCGKPGLRKTAHAL